MLQRACVRACELVGWQWQKCGQIMALGGGGNTVFFSFFLPQFFTARDGSVVGGMTDWHDDDDPTTLRAEWWKRRRTDCDRRRLHVRHYIILYTSIYIHIIYILLYILYACIERYSCCLAARHHRISRPDNNNNNIYNRCRGARGECVFFSAPSVLAVVSVCTHTQYKIIFINNSVRGGGRNHAPPRRYFCRIRQCRKLTTKKSLLEEWTF